MNIFSFNDYRSYLKEILSERVIRNPSYSLRAFAKSLGISSSNLSEVLNAKTNLSAELAAKIGRSLKLTRDEMDYFCLLVLYSQTKNLDFKNSIFDRLSTVKHKSGNNPSLELFTAVADWYSSAVFFFSEKISSKKLNNESPSLTEENIREGEKKLQELHKMLAGLILLLPVISSAEENRNEISKVQGTYQCPEYKDADNFWGAYSVSFTQGTLAGIPVVLSHTLGLSKKVGPYDKDIAIIDNKFRYAPFYRNNKLYPVRIKHWQNENKICWQAEYPDYVDNNGEMIEASSGEGEYWVDESEDLIMTASHFTGMYKCKRIKE